MMMMMMVLCCVILPLLDDGNNGLVTAFIVINRYDNVLCHHHHPRPNRLGGRGVITTGSSSSSSSSLSILLSTPQSSSSACIVHTVDGVTCREVYNELPTIGTITILEATAEGQEELVDEILLGMEDNDDDHNDNDGNNDDGQAKSSNQKQKRIVKDDPYGAVLWPAAWAVSNYLISTPSLSPSHPGSIASQSSGILELGTGTGFVSIAAAMAGAKRVVATDYEPLALKLTRYAAEKLNGNVNEGNPGDCDMISSRIETHLLDVCDLDVPLPIHGSCTCNNNNNDDEDDGTINPPTPHADDVIDVVVAADIMYEPRTGTMLAHRAVEALKQNCRVIIGDSPSRAGRPVFLQTLKELGVTGCSFQDTIGKTCSGPRHDLICGEGSLSVSDTPKELVVAILDLHPRMLHQ